MEMLGPISRHLYATAGGRQTTCAQGARKKSLVGKTPDFLHFLQHSESDKIRIHYTSSKQFRSVLICWKAYAETGDFILSEVRLLINTIPKFLSDPDSQLGLMMDTYSSTYSSRLSHSLLM